MEQDHVWVVMGGWWGMYDSSLNALRKDIIFKKDISKKVVYSCKCATELLMARTCKSSKKNRLPDRAYFTASFIYCNKDCLCAL